MSAEESMVMRVKCQEADWSSRSKSPSKIFCRPICPLSAASSRCRCKVGLNSMVVTKKVQASQTDSKWQSSSTGRAVPVAEHTTVRFSAELGHFGAFGISRQLAGLVVKRLDLLGDGELFVGDAAVGDPRVDERHGQ